MPQNNGQDTIQDGSAAVDTANAAHKPLHGLHIPLRLELDAAPRAPLNIHQAIVLPEWIDYNGHLNMAYYVLMFDNATDHFFDLIDLGRDYVERRNHSAFV